MSIEIIDQKQDSANQDNRFYVYVYLDPRKPGKFKYDEFEFDYEPFYVGKGTNNRINEHLMKCNLKNNNKSIKARKIKNIIKETNQNPIIIKYKENLLEQDALDLEKLMIKTIGRIDLKGGVLSNLTDGGDKSTTGYLCSETTKNNIREGKAKNMIGRKYGFLKVIRLIKSENHISYYECLCENCNNTIVIPGTYLNKKTNCGCIKRVKQYTAIKNKMIGRKYGFLKVIKFDHTENDNTNKILNYYQCLCENCGNIFIISGSGLSVHKHCGCLNLRMNHKTEYKGITKREDSKKIKYRVYLYIKGAGGKSINVGTFNNLDDAVKAQSEKAKSLNI